MQVYTLFGKIDWPQRKKDSTSQQHDQEHHALYEMRTALYAIWRIFFPKTIFVTITCQKMHNMVTKSMTDVS